MSDVQMTPTQSSNIKAIGTDGPKLRVQFHSGQTWEYDDAAHHHQPMLDLHAAGESVGKYFNANVRGKHEGRMVTA